MSPAKKTSTSNIDVSLSLFLRFQLCPSAKEFDDTSASSAISLQNVCNTIKWRSVGNPRRMRREEKFYVFKNLTYIRVVILCR